MCRRQSRLRWAALGLALILALRPVAQAAAMPVRATALARAQVAGHWCGPAAAAAFVSAPAAAPTPAPPPSNAPHCDDAPCCLPVHAILVEADQPAASRLAPQCAPLVRDNGPRRVTTQLRLPLANGPPVT